MKHGDSKDACINDEDDLEKSTKNGSKMDGKKSSCTIGTAVLVTVAILITAAVLSAVLFTVITVPEPEPGIHFPPSDSPLGVYRFASVAADAGTCSEIGTKILAQGGSAVDGAIAATICTGAINMHNSGVGGGSFMTVWDQKSQQGYVIDSRETAPMNSTQDMYDLYNISSFLGPYAIGVPGEIAGYYEAHKRFGKVPWSWLFQPTIKLCREGFKVTSILEGAIEESSGDIAKMPDQSPYETMKKFFINPETGKFYKENDTIKCPLLANTMEQIADSGGAYDFYNGSLAQDILADLSEIKAPINQTDLENYEALWREPVSTELQGRFNVISTPPPGSGAILGFILSILGGYNFNTTSRNEPLTYHRIVEAFKFGYAKRTYLGDESFVKDLGPLIANLTNPSYGEHIRSMINDSTTHPTWFYDPDIQNPVRNHGTSHISVIDALGNAVGITSTINTYFGSCVMGSRTGIIFNNEMDDFSSPNETNYFNLPPSVNNFIKPGKRPQSSTVPAVIVEYDQGNKTRAHARLVVGSAGGSRITSGVAYISTRVLYFNETVKEAVDALRLHHQLYPESLYFETGMPGMLLEDLYSRGHVNQTERLHMSTAQAIQRAYNGSILANCDYRKQGIAYPDGF